MLRLSRANLFGTMDPIIQAATAIRYQRDLTSLMAGPYLTSFLQDITKIIGLMPEPIGVNKESTNTAEYNAIRSAYYMIAAPLAAATLSMIPGGPLIKAGAGAAMQYVTSPQRSHDVAKAIVGESDAKPKQKPSY
jgi:hypothetical protein